MLNPIPSPRPSSDPLYRPHPTLPRRHPRVGPACQVCEDPSCRELRAERLPRLGGHRSEYAREHAQAARVQAQNRHVVTWWGEATRSFWVASSDGLTEARDIDALLLLWGPHTDPPTARSWVQNLGRPRPSTRAPAMA